MKKLLFYLSALFLMSAFSIACSDEMVVHNAPPEVGLEVVNDTNALSITSEEMTVLRTMDGKSPKISQDEAINIAAKFLGKNSLSKSTSNVRCDVVTRQKSSISKSGSQDTDTMMYILNYGNDEGYALVCADIRVPDQILAFSESGCMNTETDNPGVQLFMDLAEGYMDASIFDIERKRDSLEDVLHDKFYDAISCNGKQLSKSRTVVESRTIEYYHSTFGPEILGKQEPLLHTYWNQKSPFNDYVPFCSDEGCSKVHRCPAGCVAVATSQLMAYWKYPQIVDGVVMGWNSLYFKDRFQEDSIIRTNSIYRSRVATLLKYVGAKVKMKYGCKSSSSSTPKAVSYLKSIGYNVSGIINFRSYDAIKSLFNKRPVYIGGFREYSNKQYSHGHDWLLDGYIEERTTCTHYYVQIVTYRDDFGTLQTESYYTTSQDNDPKDYFHCKWGWGNEDDGYYLSYVFDTGKQYGVNSEDEVYLIGGASSSSVHYKYRVEIVPDIYR